MSAKTGIIVGVFLLVGALLFSGAALLRGGAAGRPRPAEPARTPASESAGESSPAGIPVELAAMNLFHPLRGAAPQKNGEAPPSPVRQMPPGDFILTGIFSFGEERGAVIASDSPRDGKPGAPIRRIFRTGAEVGDGYVLSGIQEDGVTLIRGDRRLVLHFQKDKEQKKKMREEKREIVRN